MEDYEKKVEWLEEVKIVIEEKSSWKLLYKGFRLNKNKEVTKNIY